MLGVVEQYRPTFADHSIELVTPDVVQIMTEAELVDIIGDVDGWIIGDDPATRQVFEQGKRGNLKAAVKWGVGVDNVDFDACAELGIPISNTPGMFGAEVADIAVGYVVALARETFEIDREVKRGNWPKPRGISLKDKKVALIGLGDIGQNIARRLSAAEMKVSACDPAFSTGTVMHDAHISEWPDVLGDADFVVVSCELNSATKHMINGDTLAKMKPGVRIVNISRGPIIEEQALVDALQSERVHSAALDVFEVEPLPATSPLREFPRCIFGSHNASNTVDAVVRTSDAATDLILQYLGKRK